MSLKGRSILTVVAVLVAGGLVLAMGDDRLPPRTAHKVARVISGLPLSSEAPVLAFEDSWNLNGDGRSLVVLRIPEGHLGRVLSAAEALGGYGPLKSEDLHSPDVVSRLGANASGISKSTGSVREGTTVVVDTTTARILVHIRVS